MEIDYAVYSLSDEFYEKYQNPPYKELLKKKERRYACLLIQSHYGYFIEIDFSDLKTQNTIDFLF